MPRCRYFARVFLMLRWRICHVFTYAMVKVPLFHYADGAVLLIAIMPFHPSPRCSRYNILRE